MRAHRNEHRRDGHEEEKPGEYLGPEWTADAHPLFHPGAQHDPEAMAWTQADAVVVLIPSIKDPSA
ncbi:MAG: hypothetical protein ACRDGS_16945 [Chloroflexota bacterium]